MPFQEDDKPLFEPFSVRERVDLPSLYSLDPISDEFRAHLVHILVRLVGTRVIDGTRHYGRDERRSADLWNELATDVAEALGKVRLDRNEGLSAYAVTHHIEAPSTPTLAILDTIETVIHKCRSWAHPENRTEQSVAERVDRACAEINQRFRQHHLAYRIQDDLIIRVDSQYVHREVTARAFTLLHSSDFEGASEEFMKAHTHYLDGEPRLAIASAHSAFESTLKTICDRKGWKYNKDTDGAKRLIDIALRERQLLPDILLPSFKKYLEAMEHGLPKLGNKKGRHGQGSVSDTPSDPLAAYALHLSAANIVLLIEAFLASKQDRDTADST